MEGVRTCSCPQVILCYPWLCMYITGYPGISLANDAAPASPTRLAWRTLLICPWRTHGTRALSCSSSAFCALKTEGPPRIPAGRMAPMTLKHVLCFSALLRSSSCLPQGPWIVPPPNCTSSPLLLSCTSPPANLCLVECHTFPVPCKATLLQAPGPTIPHKLWHLKASAFQYGIADAAAVDGRRGSNVYEVNPWLWQFGRGRPRLGGLSVSETEERREAVVRAGAKRSQETRRRREAARRGDE